MTSSTTQNTPIILFVYNRPEHTKRTVESLAKNALAKESTLYIFSDAAKNGENDASVQKVREYIATLEASEDFDAVIVEKSEKNRGLADSIIYGVTKVMQKHGCAIVLEDDLITAPDFLDFMNEALVLYEKDERIGSVSGYSPLQTLPSDYKEDVLMASRSSSLGWGTWKDRWDDVDWEVKAYESFKQNKTVRKRFDECGSDQFDRLRRQMESGADSWAVRFSFWQVQAKRYTIFPAVTRIQHIGWDGSGVHGTYSGPLDTHIQEYPVAFTLKSIEPDPKVIKKLRSVYSGSLTTRIARYLRNNGFEKVESLLRRIVRK